MNMLHHSDALEVHVEKRIMTQTMDIHLLQPNQQGGLRVRAPGEWVLVPPGSETVAPSIQLKYDEAQQLADELWRQGIRPSKSENPAEAMSVLSRHLQDMRTIAMGFLEGKYPGGK